MHFRERGNVVQLIRTTYDSASKKAKNEIVGRLLKTNPNISDDLKATLTSEEHDELTAWIHGRAASDRLKRELAARTLAEQITLAKDWFKGHKGDDARALAATLSPAWMQLRAVLKRNELVE
jgi:hypothetical protein